MSSSLFGDAPRPTYTGLSEDQRAIRALILDADAEIDQSTRSFNARLVNTAWAGVINAGGRLDRAQVLLLPMPEDIERIETWVLVDNEGRRRILREEYAKLRSSWNDTNRKVQAMQRDIGAEIGLDLGLARTIIDALRTLRDQTRDPAERARIDAIIQALEGAASAHDIGGMRRALEQALDVLGGSAQGRQAARQAGISDIEDAKTSIRDSGNGGQGGTGRGTGTGTGTGTGHGSGLGTGHGSGPGTGQGSAPGAGVPGGASAASNFERTGDGGIYVRDPRTGEVRFYRNEDLTGVNAGYIGERGSRLTAEILEQLELVDNPAQPGGKLFAPQERDKRDWRFQIRRSQERRLDSGGYEIEFTLMDPAHPTGFSVTDWALTAPDGSRSSGGRGQKSFSTQLTQAGNYTVAVSGTTEWGSPFRIEQVIEISR